jgi:hypothetical protein
VMERLSASYESQWLYWPQKMADWSEINTSITETPNTAPNIVRVICFRRP